eukprot:Gb_02945 [translate_table: standard]
MLRPKQLIPLCKGARSLLVSGVRNNSVDGGSTSCSEDDTNIRKPQFNSSDYATHKYSHSPSSSAADGSVRKGIREATVSNIPGGLTQVDPQAENRSKKNDELKASFNADKYRKPSYRGSSEPAISSVFEAPRQEYARDAKVQTFDEHGAYLSTSVPNNSGRGGLKAVGHISGLSDSQEAKYCSSNVQADMALSSTGVLRRKPKSTNISTRTYSASSRRRAEVPEQNVLERSNKLAETQRPMFEGYGERPSFAKARKAVPSVRRDYAVSIQKQEERSFPSSPAKLISAKGYSSTTNAEEKVLGKSAVSQTSVVPLSGINEQPGNEIVWYENSSVSQPSSAPCFHAGLYIGSESDIKLHANTTIARSNSGKFWTNGNDLGLPQNRRRGMNKGQVGGNKKINASASQQAFLPVSGGLVQQVSNILRQMYWGPAAEEALSNLNVKLNVYQVNQVLKLQQEPGLALNFFNWAKGQAGFKHDGHSYTTMIGILGRARKFELINRLLDEMRRDGCEPNVVTYNRLIHCYGRANYIREALNIFYEMQEAGCRPDRVTYCTLIDIHAKSGYLDVSMDMYRNMQQAGLLPDTFTYSVIINCLGKAGELSAAYKLYCEMIEQGCVPNMVTYNIIIDLHAKARKYPIALKLYRDMQNAGFHPDQVTYSIVMEVLGQCGRIEEAEAVFMEMQHAGWVPDEPVYGLLVDMWGKAGNVEKASQWYSKMLNSGLRPNVPTCNSLLSAFVRAHMFNDAHMVLQTMFQLNLFPSLQTYTLLLSCCTASGCEQDMCLFSGLLANTGHPAHSFLVSLPAAEPGGQNIREHAANFFDLMHSEDQESKRGFADAMMNFLHKSDLKEEAGFVWEVAMEKNLYPHAVTLKAPKYWSINLHVMSIGTALVALSRTLARFRERMLMSGVEPDRIDIITGWGRRSRVMGSSLVKQSVEQVLQIFGSPFSVENGNSGCFVGFGKPLIEWLHESHLERMHLL